MGKSWTFHKLTKLENLFDQEIIEFDRIEGAYEVDEGFEVHFYGERAPSGKQIVPPRILRVSPVIEDGKARIRFEVVEPEADPQLEAKWSALKAALLGPDLELTERLLATKPFREE